MENLKSYLGQTARVKPLASGCEESRLSQTGLEVACDWMGRNDHGISFHRAENSAGGFHARSTAFLFYCTLTLRLLLWLSAFLQLCPMPPFSIHTASLLGVLLSLFESTCSQNVA